MKVSVIIPVYNEEDLIVDCLESLGKQTYGDFEIIVVDDGSTDNSVTRVKNIAKTLTSIDAKQFSPIILLKQKHLGAGSARNLGAKKAGGGILVFVDADMTFDKDFIKKLVKPINDGQTKGTTSHDEFVSNLDQVWSKCWGINEGWEERRRHKNINEKEDKVFRALLKEQFDRVEGFTPGGYTDDYSLAEKLGYKAKVVPGAKFNHKNPESLAEIYKQSKWVGKRTYKLGGLGTFMALLRASFPVSIVIALYKSIINRKLNFFVFKIVYDFGVFVGILQYTFTGKGTK